MVETLIQDLRYALRRLAKSPRFTLVTLLILALGVGATSTLFTVVHSVLLSPLPFDDPAELVFAWETRQDGTAISPVSPLNFREWRAAAMGFLAVAAVRQWPQNVTGGDVPERVSGAQVSAGLLSLFRVTPLVGREFTSEEEQPGAGRICLVSHEYWLQRLSGRQDLTSLRLVLNGQSHDVVGVLPDGFEIPGFGPTPILTPLPLDTDDPGFWSYHNAQVFGRLADGVSVERADRELDAIAVRLQTTYPDWNDGIGARVVSARDQIVQSASQALWILFGSVAFVLLIACANIASLFLARCAEAEREMAVRTALGACRARIVRLVLSEAAILGAAGGLLGFWLCLFGVDAIRRWAPSAMPRLAEVSVNLPVVAFAFAVSVGTALLFGVVPALRTSRVNVQHMLKEGGRALGAGDTSRIQRALVVSEVAIAVVLLVGSGLLLRTFGNLMKVDPGFDLEGRTALQVSLPRLSYPDRQSVTAFLDELHERLDAIPGVQASASSVGLPFQGMMWRKLMTLEDQPAATLPEVPVVDLSIVTPRWLETLNIPLVRGRALLESDDGSAPFVALVNEAFVRTHFPGQDPLGRRLRLGPPDHLLPDRQDVEFPWYTIVGVVGDVRRWSLSADALPEVFIDQRQDMDVAHDFYVVAHTGLPAETLIEPMRQAVWDVDPDQPVAWVQTMNSTYSPMVAQPRFNAVLVAAFGLSALLLSVIGVYGLITNAVSARKREIGLRIALGAHPGKVMRHVVGGAVLATGAGITLGLVLSLALARLITSLLFGVEPLDPATYVLVVVVVLVVAVAAATVPSWRAAKLDPAAALREE